MADPADADVIRPIQRDAVPSQRVGGGWCCRSRFVGLDLVKTCRLGDVFGKRSDAGGVESGRNKLYGIIAGTQRQIVHAVRAGLFLACLARAPICDRNQNVCARAARWIGDHSGNGRLSLYANRGCEQDAGEESEGSGNRNSGWHPEIAPENRDHDSLQRNSALSWAAVWQFDWAAWEKLRINTIKIENSRRISSYHPQPLGEE